MMDNDRVFHISIALHVSSAWQARNVVGIAAAASASAASAADYDTADSEFRQCKACPPAASSRGLFNV